MAGEVLGWCLGLLLRVRPWMEVLTNVWRGQLQMAECLKAVCLMVKGSGEVAGGVCASMHDTHKIRRVVAESGEHYGWFMERQEDKFVEFIRMLCMVVENGPHKIRRVVVESGEHYGWRVESTMAGEWKALWLESGKLYGWRVESSMAGEWKALWLESGKLYGWRVESSMAGEWKALWLESGKHYGWRVESSMAGEWKALWLESGKHYG